MKSRTLTCITAITLFAVLAIPARLAAQKQTQYTVIFVGNFGGSFSEAVGVNNRGSASGNSHLPGDTVNHGYFWRKGTMTDLGTLGGPNSFAPEEWSPNERDQVAGFSDTSALDPNAENFCGFLGFYISPYICRPFVWQRGGMTELPTLGGNNAAAVAINNRGQLAGVSENTIKDPACNPPQLFDFEAVIWGPQKNEIQELPPLPGDTLSSASGINDSGQAIGASGNCAVGPIEAVLWQDRKPINLGSLGGAVFNIAFGINNRGQVVGQSDLQGDTTHHAFLWQNGVMTDLGTILGLPLSLATSINNKGQVVGFSQDQNSNNTVAWIWQNGSMTDLNTLIIPADSSWFLIEALGINDRGQIAGYGFNASSGACCAVLLSPTNSNLAGEVATHPVLDEIEQEQKVLLPEKMVRSQMSLQHHWPPDLLRQETSRFVSWAALP